MMICYSWTAQTTNSMCLYPTQEIGWKTLHIMIFVYKELQVRVFISIMAWMCYLYPHRHISTSGFGTAHTFREQPQHQVLINFTAKPNPKLSGLLYYCTS